VQREILHGVGVRAELTQLRVDGRGGEPLRIHEAARIEIGRAGHETVTPARDDVRSIAVGDDELVGVARRDAAERALAGRRIAARRNSRTGGEARARGGRDQCATREACLEDRGEFGSLIHGDAC
jgi:hypothetical protein